MAKSTGIALTATGISFANEWVQTDKPNWRILAAGLGITLVFDGVEKLNERAAVGLATIMLITVLLTPIKGKSAADSVLDLVNNKKPPKGLPRA